MERGKWAIELIKEMATEYQGKLDALVSATRSMDSSTFWKTARAHGERTTDRFREIQSRFVNLLEKTENNESLVKAFKNLSRCFDEMQALFIVMSDRYFDDVVEKRGNDGGE